LVLVGRLEEGGLWECEGESSGSEEESMTVLAKRTACKRRMAEKRDTFEMLQVAGYTMNR
jgi:hypothetical protein